MNDASPDISEEIRSLRSAVEQLVQRARAERGRYADALAGAMAERDAQLAALQKEADARLAALEETTLAAQTFETEYRMANSAAENFQQLYAEERGRREQLESEVSVLRDACDERLDLIERQAAGMRVLQTAVAELNQELKARGAIIEDVRNAANQRLNALAATTAELMRLRAAAGSGE